MESSPHLWLVRHGETAWSLSGQHTGRTDIPLTPNGVRQALRLKPRLDRPFALVLTSPLVRASETCRLAGLGDRAVPEPDLMEWDYGAYEGRTSAEIRIEKPGWSLWEHGVPGGETAEAVGERCDRVIERALAAKGDVALFAHGHVLRVFAARWLKLAVAYGGAFALSPTGIGILGFEPTGRVIQLWNDTHHVDDAPRT